MAGPSPVWKADGSPESRDYCVHPKEPINQSGLTTESDSLCVFSSINKERRVSATLLERVCVLYSCMGLPVLMEDKCLILLFFPLSSAKLKHDAFVTADTAERLLRRLRLFHHQLHDHAYKKYKKKQNKKKNDLLIHF